jgi:hypothetical protein
VDTGQCGFMEQKQNRTGVNNMVCKMVVNEEDAPELECITFAKCGGIESRWWPSYSWASMSVPVVVESVPRWQALR